MDNLLKELRFLLLCKKVYLLRNDATSILQFLQLLGLLKDIPHEKIQKVAQGVYASIPAVLSKRATLPYATFSMMKYLKEKGYRPKKLAEILDIPVKKIYNCLYTRRELSTIAIPQHYITLESSKDYKTLYELIKIWEILWTSQNF